MAVKRSLRLKILGGLTAGLAVLFLLMLCLKIPALGLDGTDFCGSCHVMDPQVETYVHSAHRLNATCGDCHVPHHLVRGAFDKAWTGTVDLIGVIRNKDPYEIHASDHAKRVIQENCVRCHKGILEEIGDTMTDGGKACFDCHRNTPHAIKPNMTNADLKYVDQGQGLPATPEPTGEDGASQADAADLAAFEAAHTMIKGGMDS